MIKQLLDNLMQYDSVYKKLISEFPNLLPIDYYEKALQGIYYNAPHKTELLNSLLNTAARELRFQESNLNFESMLDQFKNRWEEMDELIERSKDDKEIFLFPKHDPSLYKAIEAALFQINSSAERVLDYYYDAKEIYEERNKKFTNQ